MEFIESLPVTFKEIAPNNNIPEKWKEIVLNTGGSHSTLQDIKLPQKAGGYWYRTSDKANTRNRFIYWQTTSDSIEFSEASLDVNLTSAHLRCKVAAGTPPLNGMSVHERPDTRDVVILAATVSSVHRMVFPHPEILDRKATYGSLSNSTPSIFHDTSSIDNPNNYHILNQYSTPTGGVAHTCASTLRDSGEAVFLLALGGGAGGAGGTEGGVLLVRLPLAGPASTTMLQRESAVPRFLSGITTALRGWGERVETYGVALTQWVALGVGGDGCVRAWPLDAPAGPLAVTGPLANVCARPPPHGHGLRVWCEEKGRGEAVVAAYLSCGAESQFAVLRLRGSGADARFSQIATIYGPQLELVDFAIGRRDDGHALWALWSQPTGDSLVTYTSVGAEARWEAVMSAGGAPALPVLSSHQQYCGRLLAPGLFCAPIVRKALSIYRRRWGGCETTGAGAGEEGDLGEACMSAVAARLRQLTARAPQHDHTQLLHKCWSDLYSWCAQYLEGLQKPLGFMLYQHTSGGGGWWSAVVRRAGVALVRQLEPLERIVLSAEPANEIESCAGLSADAARVVAAGATWERLAGGAGAGGVRRAGGAVAELERLLFAAAAPQHRLLPRLLHLLTSEDTLPALSAAQVEQVTAVLRPIRDLQSAVLELNDALRLDVPGTRGDQDEDSSEYDNLFASDLGVSVLTESIRQMAEMRCVVVGGALAALSLWRGAEGVPGAGHCAVHWQAYRALLWLRAQPILNNAPNELFRLKLSALGAEPATACVGVGAGDAVWAYCRGAGGGRARGGLAAAAAHTHWPHALPLLTHHLAHQLWAVSGGFEFGWWLARMNQPRLVASYVAMLEPWCEWNACSRQFILGLALLDLDDHERAYSAFCKAAKGVTNEPFLQQLVCSQDASQLTQNQALVLYYMKVIKLLEIHEAGACVVRLAETAISIADADDPNLAMFQWLVFKWHLSGGRVQRALSAAAACRAPPARAAAAAALLTELGPRGSLGALVVCGALTAEAERAASSRAKLHDPQAPNPHYDFLYALHVHRHHYRKAAATAYERAVRCGATSCGGGGGGARRKWLAAALTALRLASPQHAFLATHNMQVIGVEELAAELRAEEPDFLSPIEQALQRGGELDLDLVYTPLMSADAGTLLAVLTRALANSQFLPKWFLDRYMEVDSGGMVRALLSGGRAVEAAAACVRALRRSLQALSASAPPQHAPVALADVLLLELEPHRDMPHVGQVLEELEHLTREYGAVVERTSRDMRQLAHVTA